MAITYYTITASPNNSDYGSVTRSEQTWQTDTGTNGYTGSSTYSWHDGYSSTSNLNPSQVKIRGWKMNFYGYNDADATYYLTIDALTTTESWVTLGTGEHPRNSGNKYAGSGSGTYTGDELFTKLRVRETGNGHGNYYLNGSVTSWEIKGSGDNYASGETVTVTATPASGYRFINWTENGVEVSISAEYVFTVSQNRDLVANFDLAECTLNLSVSPQDSGYINIGWKAQFPQGLRSAGSVYDEINETKAIKRVESVDLGSLYWGYFASNDVFYATISDKKPYISNSSYAQLLCSAYAFGGATGLGSGGIVDKTIYNRASPTDNQIIIKDTSYSDATSFTNAMQGVMLNFELATEEETDITFDYSYDIVNGGTESVNSSVPIIADILYPSGLKTDQTFISRQTTEDGIAKVKVLKGNTLKFNQLITDANIHVQSTSSVTWMSIHNSSFSLVAGHIYYATLKGTVVEGGNIGVRDSAEGIVYRPQTGYSLLYTSTKTTTNTTFIQGNWNAGTTDAYLNVFDLTEMFGSGNEPTLAEFNSYFTDDYYEYNTGELLSFDGTEITTIGFNQWDEEWEVGMISWSGNNYPSNERIRSTNYIPCKPNTQYYVKTPKNLQFFYYDEDEVFVSHQSSSMANQVFTTPSNAHYMRFYTYSLDYGTTYNHDICINISNASLNGTYEPYQSNSYPIYIGYDNASFVFDGGTEISVEAVSDIRTFSHWSVDDSAVSTNNPYTFTITNDMDLVAVFVNVIAVNIHGAGVVSGAGTYQNNDTCTLLATPHNSNGFRFYKENDTILSSNTSYSFTVTGNRTIDAFFTGIFSNIRLKGNKIK